jgi:PAS domain S-box-containing protein
MRIENNELNESKSLMNLAKEIEKGKGEKEHLLQLIEQSQLILNSATEGILGLDLKGNHTFFNLSTITMLGFTKEEFENVHSHSLWHHSKPNGNPYPEEECPIHNTLRNGKRNRISSEIFWRKDGTSFPVEYTSSPIYEHEKVIGAVVTFLDITERKNVVSTLQESEEKLRLIMENSPDAIFIANQQGKYTYVNKAVTVMLGYSSDEMKEKTIADISPPHRIEEYFEIFNKVLAIGKGFAEIELVKSDGGIISTDLNVVLLPDGTVYASCRDITERKKAEELLKQNESALNLAQRIANMGSWELDVTNFEAKWSENCFALYGLKPYEIEPSFEYVKSRIHPHDTQKFGETMEKMFKDKSPITYEVRYTYPDNQYKWFHLNMIPILQDEELVKLKGIMIDVTDRKNAEEKLKESEKSLVQLNADKDRFISILGHDLKNPINSFLGLSEVLMEDLHKVDIDKVEMLVNQINLTAKSTYKLLEGILMWVGAQQGKIPFKPYKIGFRDICLDTLETLNPTARAKNISINYSASDEINIFADVDMLKTVLRNLVSNAIKFTNDGGTINIDAEENIENVTISVSDNGVGIAPDALKKLFDITEVLTTKGTAGETGTGLGTLLCKEFVEKHQGKIWVESTLGEGSKFLFTVPGETDQKEFTY